MEKASSGFSTTDWPSDDFNFEIDSSAFHKLHPVPEEIPLPIPGGCGAPAYSGWGCCNADLASGEDVKIGGSDNSSRKAFDCLVDPKANRDKQTDFPYWEDGAATCCKQTISAISSRKNCEQGTELSARTDSLTANVLRILLPGERIIPRRRPAEEFPPQSSPLQAPLHGLSIPLIPCIDVRQIEGETSSSVETT